MPYVKGFTNDIFISFAHIDDSDGWVATFHARLENRLAQLGVEEVTVWRDTRLRGTQDFSREIFTQLRNSAILVTIISPSSVKAEWCRDERQKFEQYADLNGGFQLGTILRAVNVVKTPLDNDEHYSNALGFEFYERNEQTQRIHEFDPGSSEFRDRIDALAQDIRHTLNTLRDKLSSTDTRRAVYVATTSSDLETKRAEVVTQIEVWGYSVLPNKPLSMANFRSEVESALAKCILSVHLVGSKRSMIPEGEEKSIVALQYECAQARRMDRVLWIAPDSQPDPGILSLMEDSQQGVDILEGRTIDYLKEVIGGRLNRLRPKTSLTKDSNKFNVYMVCDRTDHPGINDAQGCERARQLKDYLDSKGLVVWLPPLSAMEETQRRRDHREILDLSDAVLLFWGSADEKWFRDNVRELIKARMSRSGSGYLAEAIYFGGPPLTEKSLYRHHLELVFEQFDAFVPEGLNPLLQRLQRQQM